MQPEQQKPKPQPTPQRASPAPAAQRSAAAAPARSRAMTFVYGAVVVAALAVGAVATGLVHVPGIDSGAGAPATSATQQTDTQQVDQGLRAIGGRISTVTPDFAKSHQMSRTSGVLVVEVFGNSPLERSGVHANDVVVAIDGVPIGGAPDLQLKIRLTPVGQQLALTIDRGGATENHAVTVARCLAPTAAKESTCTRWSH